MLKKKIEIEKAINKKLKGEAQRNALDFVAFLRANERLPKHHESGHGWPVMYGSEEIGFVIVVNGDENDPLWEVFLMSCDFGETADEDLKAVAWAHANECGRCHDSCKDYGGVNRTMFGKEFEQLCHAPLGFFNPDAKTLEQVKKLMLMLK